MDERSNEGAAIQEQAQLKERGTMDNEKKEEKKGVFDFIEGLTAVDPKALAAFRQAMIDEVIPEIIKVVEERRVLAAESRKWQLKC